MMKKNKSPRDKKSIESAFKRHGAINRKPVMSENGASRNEPVMIEGRVAKIIARAGVASRREAEQMIREGRVKLNNTILTSPGVNARGQDKIEIDGKPIAVIERTRLWLYHKPGGMVTTNYDPEGRSTVFANLPDNLPRVMSVGRLDINTEGLSLLTNDGGLARILELPSTGWLRRYRVRAFGQINPAKLEELKNGIAVNGVLYGSIEASLDRVQGSNLWMTMGLREGKNREIKLVLGALGLEVNRLIRISYGPFQLGELSKGHVVEVKGRMLRDQLGPRLIADSGARFDAPLRPYEQKEKPENAEQKPGSSFKGGHGQKAFKRTNRRDEYADEKIGSLKTGYHQTGEKSHPKEPGQRTANVWMGKGARPVIDKKEQDIQKQGRQPVKGNWYRPKDRLDPQKSFRSKKRDVSKGKGGTDKKITDKKITVTKNRVKKEANADRRR